MESCWGRGVESATRVRLRRIEVELAVELEFEACSLNLCVALAESRSFRNERLVKTRTERLVTTFQGWEPMS